MTTKALALVATATILDAAILTWILLRQRHKPIDMPRVSLVACTAAGLCALHVIVALFVSRSFFLVVAVVYAHLLVLVPVIAAVVLCLSLRLEITRGARRTAWAGLLIAPVFVYATFVEPYRLVTESAEIMIAKERSLTRPLSIGVLADIQCVAVTDREREAVARVLAAKPDLIVLPGDLQQSGFDQAHVIGPQLRELLAPLSAPLGVWYVEGNTETTWEARQLLAGTRVRILDDEIVHLEHEGARVTLCGVGLGFSSAKAQVVLREIQSSTADDDVRIVLAHRPDVILALNSNSRVDLVIAGHTHGGQVQLPFIGPLITLSDVPRRIAAGGLHDLDGRRIYVSRGIGWEHGHAPRVRFLCAPEVSLLTLMPEN
ncbi:MAG: metallophosphoesterase [Planctomycetes bacterium]|nr:metallophosphoesterase [Planctomycetota bacterium]